MISLPVLYYWKHISPACLSLARAADTLGLESLWGRFPTTTRSMIFDSYFHIPCHSPEVLYFMLDTIVRVAFLLEVEVKGSTAAGGERPLCTDSGGQLQPRQKGNTSLAAVTACQKLLPSWPLSSSTFPVRRQWPESSPLRNKFHLADRVITEFMFLGPGTQNSRPAPSAVSCLSVSQ